MRRSFPIIVVCFLVLLMSTAVSAFEVEVTPINTSITQGGTALVEIEVTNSGAAVRDYTVDTADFRWRIVSDPLSDYFSGFSVFGGNSKTLRLEFSPRGDLFFGIYRVRIELTELDGEQKLIDIPIEIRSATGSSLEYAPTVIVSGMVNGNDRIDPRQNSVLSLELDNRNPLDITELDVHIDSPFINEQFTTSLGPLEKKRVEFNFKVDELRQPGVEEITVTLFYRNQTISGSPKSFPVQVISYSQILRDVNDDSGFLRTEKTVFLKNQGNIQNSESLKVSTNFFKRFFTHSDPSPKVIKEGGQRYLFWDVEMNPGSTAEIVITVNYRPVLYTVLLLAAGIVLYYLLRSPVLVKKTASNINVYEGGISEMKILIHIRNRTPNTYSSFSITEHIPKIATFLKSDSLGSIQPSKVLKHERKGTLLKWNFEAIEPFEERIIIYKTKLNLTILGRFILPQTVVKYKDESNSSFTSKSNKLRVTNINNETKR
jgi:hypothetical protein